MKKTTKFAAIVFAVAASLFAAISLSACGDDGERVEPERPDPESIVGERVADAAAWEAAFDFTGIMNGSLFMYEGDGDQKRELKLCDKAAFSYSSFTSNAIGYYDAIGNWMYSGTVGLNSNWLKYQVVDPDDIEVFTDGFGVAVQSFIDYEFGDFGTFDKFLYDEIRKAYVYQDGSYVKISDGKISVVFCKNHSYAKGGMYLQIYNIGTTVVKIPDEIVKNAVEK